MGTLPAYEVIRDLYISFTSLVFNLLLWLVLIEKGYRVVRSKRAFCNMVLMVFITHLSSAFNLLISYSDLNFTPFFVALSDVFVTMSNNLMALFFTIYFIRFFGRLERREYRVPVFSYMVTGAKAVALIIWMGLALPDIYSTGNYIDMPWFMAYVIGYGFNFYHLVFCLIFFVRRCRIIRRRTRNMIFFGFAMLMSTIIIQTIIGYLPHVYYFGATIALMIFYFFAESLPAHTIVIEQLSGDAESYNEYESAYENGAARKEQKEAVAEKMRGAEPEDRRAEDKTVQADEETMPAKEETEGTKDTEDTETSPAHADPADDLQTAQPAVPQLPLISEKDDSTTKAEAKERIAQATPALIAYYRSLAKLLAPYFGAPDDAAEEALPEMDADELEELYEALLEFAKMYDQSSMERLLDGTDKMSVPQKEQACFQKVRECVRAGDWDGIREAISTRNTQS